MILCFHRLFFFYSLKISGKHCTQTRVYISEAKKKRIKKHLNASRRVNVVDFKAIKHG